jgi:AP-3 complex subunit beta
MPITNTAGTSIMTPSMGGFLTPLTPGFQKTQVEATANDSVDLVGPQFIATTTAELLNKVNGYGLGIAYRYGRSPHLYSSTMVSIELHFTNTGNVEMTEVDMVQPKLITGMAIYKFAAIEMLAPKQTVTRILGVDFNDSTQPLSFEIKSNFGVCKVTLAPPVGELIRSVSMQEAHFKKERAKLRGMTEHSFTLSPIPEKIADRNRLRQRLYEVANVGSIVSAEADVLHFAGETVSLKNLVLITIVLNGSENVIISVNCEKIVIGSMLLNEIKAALKN